MEVSCLWRATAMSSTTFFRTWRGRAMSESAANEDQTIDPIIRAEVTRIWREWIGMDPGLTSAERESRIDAEAARLTQMVDETVGDSAHGFLMEQWKDEHPGQVPDYPTTVAMIETARRSATSKILETELYPQLTEAEAEQTQTDLFEIAAEAEAETKRLRDQHDPNRWRRQMVEISDLAIQIVNRAWGASGTFEFRMLALALVQQRLEDDQRTPLTSADPIREELESMIDEELQRQTQEPPTPF